MDFERFFLGASNSGYQKSRKHGCFGMFLGGVPPFYETTIYDHLRLISLTFCFNDHITVGQHTMCQGRRMRKASARLSKNLT